MTEKLDLKIGEREMLHNRVCSVLRRAILKGDFRPGEKLVQTELADLIGVSRMPVREALRTLELEGLVVIEPHKGAVVRSISKEDIKEIYELRALLEPEALTKGIGNFTKEEINKLEEFHQGMIETNSRDHFVELNIQFHQLLINKCNRPRLLGIIGTISNGFPHDTPQIIPGQIEKSIQEHEQILNAIKNRETETAATCLSEHIRRSGEELIQSMENHEFQ
ncbi:GntR family transcriptional regulator [Oceanobacillus halophilus]|uniref:GntR family transcriptional regulator n=1 Tax=Oceanobacillus halophilus TaxID=930130 RepID=A0A495A7M4_9BACI|nr:GntR family transcriptional regulator [Oceanobacillus halophilus]RKQ35792.1 GntR family transcriptional regulator [Oceanobacillus halophilus]